MKKEDSKTGKEGQICVAVTCGQWVCLCAHIFFFKVIEREGERGVFFFFKEN